MKVKTLNSCVSKLVRRMGRAYVAAITGAIVVGSGAAEIALAEPQGSNTSELAICVVVPHFKDEYWLSVAYGLEREAARHDVALWIYESGGYHALDRQVDLLQTCVERKSSAILIGAVSADDTRLLDAIAVVSEQTPVLALVNELRSPDLAGAIGVDWRDMGMAIGLFLKNRHPGPEAAAKAVLISGPSESGWAPLLESGLRRGLQGSGVSIVDARGADTGLREQMREVEHALQEVPEADYLIGSAPAIEAAMGLLAARPIETSPILVATYISHSIRRGLGGGRVIAVPFDDPIEQGRLGVQMAIDAVAGKRSIGLVGPVVNLLTADTEQTNEIPLSPAGFLPSIQ